MEKKEKFKFSNIFLSVLFINVEWFNLHTSQTPIEIKFGIQVDIWLSLTFFKFKLCGIIF